MVVGGVEIIGLSVTLLEAMSSIRLGWKVTLTYYGWEFLPSVLVSPQLNPFRSITALLMAFLVVVPLCCCTLNAADTPVKHSCCSPSENNESKEKGPCECACKSKEPRDEVKNFELPLDQVTPFVPVVQDLGYLSRPFVRSEPMAGTPHTGCDPPRLRLAIYSRWLL